MMRGAVTISIDLELAWGNWDDLQPAQIRHIEESERPIVSRLVEILDRYEVPVTWAFVSALLDRHSAVGRQGSERLWYAPDVIDNIRSAKVRHDLGCHGGRHRYFDAMTDAEASEELVFARQVHEANGLSFCSFVFPRNKVAKTHLLEQHGIKVYRGRTAPGINGFAADSSKQGGSPTSSTKCCRSRRKQSNPNEMTGW